MEDDQLLRYSRQIMLPDVDIAGQERLRAARVLVVGIGGLGSPVALYLAAAGIGQLTLCDDDKVDLSNLQRQIAHTTASIGENKAVSAKVRLAALNPDVDIQVIDQRLDAPGLTALLANVDLVMDCTDNFDSRYVINDICWHAGVPVVSGAAIRWEGQISLFDPAVEGAPCYRCLYPSGPSDDDGALSCSENGVIAPLVGIIGTSQALEALKYLMGVGDSLAGYVLYLDSKFSEWRKLKLSPRPGCPTCGD